MAERKWHKCPHCGAPLEEAGQRSYGWKCVYCGGVMLEDRPDYNRARDYSGTYCGTMSMSMMGTCIVVRNGVDFL